MSVKTKEHQYLNSSHQSMGAKGSTEIELEATRPLRICPRKVLGSLGRLRIARTRIKPLEDKAPKAGGKADVEAAILGPPRRSSTSVRSEALEYIAVKKLRFDTDTDDYRVLAPFAHEVKLLNDLSHPSVVKIVGFVEDVKRGIAWMVFSWEKNGNLREFVRSVNWELPERVSLISDVAEGLSYLHGSTPPICHGDLKSLNILVNSENRAIITDFGSARTVDSATEEAFRSAGAAAAIRFQHRMMNAAPTPDALKAEPDASGRFITMTGPAWTIRWAAPELLEGHSPGLASDIWALVWICWEAVTGNFPFDEENDFAIVLRITGGDLPAVGENAQLKQIKALCSLMGECWRLDANERPTAIKCQQVISFMHKIIPSRSEGHRLGTTRSSGLLYALGQIELHNGRMLEAEEYFQESSKVSKSVGDKEGRVRALQALGEVYRMQNEDSKAEELYIQARDICSQFGHRLGFAHSVRGLGDVYHMRSEYSKAEKWYIQARDIYSQVGDKLSFAKSVKCLGDVYRMRNEYSKAEELYVQARDFYSQIGYQLGSAHSVMGLGNLYRMRSEYSKAEELYVQARDIYSEIGDQLGLANSFYRMGDVYRIQNKYSEAKESYIQARDIHSQIGNQVGLANSVNGLGEVYHMLGKYPKAKEFYIQARDICSQSGYQLGLANSVKGLGEVYYARGKYSKAKELYIQARDIYSEIGCQVGLANSVKGLGEVCYVRGKYSKAKDLYTQAHNILLGKF